MLGEIEIRYLYCVPSMRISTGNVSVCGENAKKRMPSIPISSGRALITHKRFRPEIIFPEIIVNG